MIFYKFFIIVLIFWEKITFRLRLHYAVTRRWRLTGNLAPCSCAATVEYTVHSCCVLIAKPDLPPQSIHRSSHKAAPGQAGWSCPMQIWLKNHNFCDIFYTSQKCSFIPPLPGFHKIRDITKFFIIVLIFGKR